MRNLWLRSCLRIAIALFIFLAATSTLSALGAAAGPWSAIVIDAHTRGPVEGAVIVATWSRRGRGHSIGFGGPDPVGVEEVVTDAHGQFTLPARTFANPPLFLPIEGPDLLIFKSAYGGWRFRDTPADLVKQGAVIELRPLTVTDERLKYVQGRMAEQDPRLGWLREGRGPESAYGLPYQRIRRYEAAINGERVLLGLPRIGLGYPYLGEE